MVQIPGAPVGKGSNIGAGAIMAIVPAFNEAENITAVISELRRHNPQTEVVVVNDGSTDNTEVVARRAGATVLSHAVNLGIGGAVQTGFIHARNQGCCAAFQFDADGQHPAEDVSRLLEPVLNDEVDVVIGSRYLSGEGYQSSFIRRLGIRMIAMVNWILTGQRISDNTSGFRAYNRKTIAYLAENYPQDYPEPETVVELIRNGFRVKEISVTMRARSGGESSIKPAHALYYIVKVLMSNVIGVTKRRVEL